MGKQKTPIMEKEQFIKFFFFFILTSLYLNGTLPAAHGCAVMSGRLLELRRRNLGCIMSIDTV